MGYLLLVLSAAVVLVPIGAQNNRSLSCPSAVGQVSRRVNQVVEQLSQLSNRLSHLENNPRQGCARATVAEGLSSSLIINKTTSFTVLVRDCGGYDLTTGGDNVTATLTCVDYPSLVSPQPTVVDNGDGSYQVSLSPECSGNNLVSVNINGKTIKDMPMTVAVIPPYTSLRLKRKIVGSVLFPYAISIAENGDVFIGGHSDHHVHHFDRNGRKLNSWRTPGNNVNAIVVCDDYVYVAQCTPPKVFNYSRSGVIYGQILGSSSCYRHLSIGPDGRLYGSSQTDIKVYNIEDGSIFHTFTAPEPLIIQFDKGGNLHTARWSSPTIRVYIPSGVLVRTYSPPSSTQSDGLFIDRAGNRLVVDRGNPSKVIITDKNNQSTYVLMPQWCLVATTRAKVFFT